MVFCYSAAATSKYEELEGLYGNIGKVICEGLSNYERYARRYPPLLCYRSGHKGRYWLAAHKMELS